MEEDQRIKVIIEFRDGTKEEFWADSEYHLNGDGIVYWRIGDKNVSYPVYTIKKITQA